MNHTNSSEPFGLTQFTQFLTVVETGEKKLETLESKHVSIVKELDDIKLGLKRFNGKSVPANLQSLHKSIKKLSKNQIYDLSILLGFYAQRQSWINPKEIAKTGKRHDYSVVIKNLTGQDQQHRWARGRPEIRKLVESKIKNKRRVFIPKGLIAEFSISFFYLRKHLNLVSDVMQLIEDFTKFIEGMKQNAVEILRISDESSESLKKYHGDKLKRKSTQQLLKKSAEIRLTNHKAMEMLKKRKATSSTITFLNDAIKHLLDEIRDSCMKEIIMKFKESPLQEVRRFFNYHKRNLEGSKHLLQYCKSYIEYSAKNHDLSRIKTELSNIISKFSKLTKMIEEVESDYSSGEITKEYYKKQTRQLEKTMEILGNQFLIAIKPFKIRLV